MFPRSNPARLFCTVPLGSCSADRCPSIRQPVGDSLTLVGYADVGGGGGRSDLTYQFMAGIDWAFARDYMARLGYRHLYWNCEKEDAVWDMAAQGF